MTDRATVYESTQVGVEVTPGTAVPADIQLLAISITPSIQAETDAFVPRGSKYATIVPLGKEWCEADIDGKGAYNDLTYLLASLVGAPSTTPLGGGAFRHTFTPNSGSPDTPTTLTIENGSSVRANRFPHGIVTELGMTFNRDEVTVEGSFLGKQLEDGITKTASPTALDLIPILPKDVTVYLDDAAADLGDTVLERAVEAEWSISDKYGPIWVLNAANPSWANHVEMAPDSEVTLNLEADEQGMELLTTIRAGSTKFLRLESVAVDEAAVGVPYQATFDFALKVTEAGDFDDSDGLATIEWSLAVVHDDTWGKAFEFSLVNTLASL